MKKQGGGGYLDSSNRTKSYPLESNKNTHIAKSNNTEFKCVERGNMKIERNNIKLNIFYFVLLLAIVFGVCFGVTYSALSNSKTATGVISIVMPPTSGVSAGNLYYDGAGTMYLGKNTDGIEITSNSIDMPKIIVADSGVSDKAYVMIIIKVLGVDNALSYDNSTALYFSNNTQCAITQNNGVITITSGQLQEYNYIFLAQIFSKISVNDMTLTNETIEVTIKSSSTSDFSSFLVNYLYYNFNSVDLSTTVTIPTNANYTITAITEKAYIGKSYTFSLTMADGYEVNAPEVTYNGAEITTESTSSPYVFTIPALSETHSIVSGITGAIIALEGLASVNGDSWKKIIFRIIYFCYRHGYSYEDI